MRRQFARGELRREILRLHGLGYAPTEIAYIVERTANTVNVTLSDWRHGRQRSNRLTSYVRQGETMQSPRQDLRPLTDEEYRSATSCALGW